MGWPNKLSATLVKKKVNIFWLFLLNLVLFTDILVKRDILQYKYFSNRIL